MNIFSDFKTIDKKTSGTFSFSLAISLLVCILTTYAIEKQVAGGVTTTLVDEIKPYIVSLFATVITFAITTLSQSFIQVISLKAKTQEVSYFWLITTLGYSFIYTILYFIYLMDSNWVWTILIVICTILCIILSILSFAEAFSTEKSSLVGEKQ